MIKKLSILAALFLAPVSGQAVTVLYYEFEADPSPETAPEITASGFGVGPEITQVNWNSQIGQEPGSWSGENWSVSRLASVALASGKYATFSITVNPDQALTIASMTFDVKPQGAGPKNYLITASDSFGNTVVIGGEPIHKLNPNESQDPGQLVSLGGTSNWETIAALPNTLTGLTGTLEFRIYGFDAQREDRALFIDNVRISGDFCPVVPEPSTFVLLGLAGLVFIRQ